jgi:hypothetical protein
LHLLFIPGFFSRKKETRLKSTRKDIILPESVPLNPYKIRNVIRNINNTIYFSSESFNCSLSVMSKAPFIFLKSYRYRRFCLEEHVWIEIRKLKRRQTPSYLQGKLSIENLLFVNSANAILSPFGDHRGAMPSLILTCSVTVHDPDSYSPVVPELKTIFVPSGDQ